MLHCMSAAWAELVEELRVTHHGGRVARMLDLGRRAPVDRGALELIDRLARGNVFERRLALFAQYTWRDGQRLLPFVQDEARSVRALAMELVPLVCDDVQALEALKVAYALRRERVLVDKLSLRKRREVVDRYLDWLAAQPGLHDFADLVPWASAAGVHRHLARALARPSAIFWDRLARFAPDALAQILVERLEAVPGEPDPVTRQLIGRHTGSLAERAPDEALVLLERLFARGTFTEMAALGVLGRSRPSATWQLIERYSVRVPYSVFAKNADALSLDELARVVRRDPLLLGDAEGLVDRLSEPALEQVTAAWCEMLGQHPYWGLPLLDRIRDEALRQRAWKAWSVSARDREGIIHETNIEKLPADLRVLEARRHGHEVVALGTRPLERIRYARFLAWDEAEQTLRAFFGHPEGGTRSIALEILLAIPGLRPKEPGLADKALAMVLARKNEQDPVRLAMVRALVRWPREVWRTEHTKAIGQILRDALDAGDLSHATALQVESLLIRTFRLDPEWGATWLGTFIAERGNIYDPRLGLHLSDDDVRAAAPHLLAVARKWSEQERSYQLGQIADSLGDRLTLVPGLGELLEHAAKTTPWGNFALAVMIVLKRFDRPRYEAGLAQTWRRWLDMGWTSEVLSLASHVEHRGGRPPPLHPELVQALDQIARGRGRNEHVVNAVTLLRARAKAHFNAILDDLLQRDESYVCIHAILSVLHRHRQDLLDPFLGERVIEGRFATGKTAWLLPFDRGFSRWTPAQNTRFAATLATVMEDKDRDTPTVWRCLKVFANLDSAPMDRLAAMAEDPRPAVAERAIRVMGRCDRGQCVPTLIACLADARARVAIYGLRRALLDMLPAHALRLLADVPLTKVTVAKEVVRLLGELRSEAAYDRLLTLDGTNLHRDVRIALLRALWDHLDREPTWAVFDRAVTGPDWVMASRVGDIPADRLTRSSDVRLSALLARLLQRDEPEARIELLGRAAFLAVSDPDRTFLRAAASRLISIYDDEVRAAMMAILHRSTEIDIQSLPSLLEIATVDPQCLHVAISALLALPLHHRTMWLAAGRAAESVLASDPRWVSLRLQCTAAASEGPELARTIVELGRTGQLSGDALEVCRRAVDKIPFDLLEDVWQVLSEAESPEARRVAVWVLTRDAGPERGWTLERRERWSTMTRDPSPVVTGAALMVFPPREHSS